MLLVSDANIFIDFEVAGLASALFQLRHEIVVPDALFSQELSTRHAHLIGLGLKTQSLTGEQVAAAYKLREQYRGTGVFDLFALVLAKSLCCPLVTGDRRLRAAATAEGLQLMGTLTLVEHLFIEGLIDLPGVEQAYEKMRSAGRRLPAKEVAAQIARLRLGL
jgi:predicted nucleic acid-binding protein